MKDESFEDFRKRLDAAMQAVGNGDSSAWEAIYSHAPDATLFGGWGGPGERGWEQLSARWKMVTGRYLSVSWQVERISEHVTPEMAVTVEIARGEARFANGSSGPVALRVTHVFRKEEREWRLVHRHADEQMTLGPIEAHLER